MRVLGIDPGYAIVGFGVIDSVGIRHKAIDYGVITTPAGIPIEDRLLMIYEQLTAIIKKHRPDAIAIEELFFNTNHTTAIPVAEARGVILLCAKQCGLQIFEYTPLQVKQAVVGYGRAEKKQVITMVTTLLELKAPPKPDDTADALALAICHSNCACSALSALHR